MSADYTDGWDNDRRPVRNPVVTLTFLAGLDFPAWMRDGLCGETDPEMFFPKAGDSGHAALAVCAACDVRLQCLGYALDHDEWFGIWGGVFAKERARLRKRWSA